MATSRQFSDNLETTPSGHGKARARQLWNHASKPWTAQNQRQAPAGVALFEPGRARRAGDWRLLTQPAPNRFRPFSKPSWVC